MTDYFHYTFPLYYGGGLSGNNIKTYLEADNVDGLLIGSVGYEVENKKLNNSSYK